MFLHSKSLPFLIIFQKSLVTVNVQKTFMVILALKELTIFNAFSKIRGRCECEKHAVNLVESAFLLDFGLKYCMFLNSLFFEFES